MATTSGLVQRLNIGEIFTCVWIGPTENNTELLLVRSDGTTISSELASVLVQTLSTAHTNYRQVTAVHADDNAEITGMRMDPI